MIALFAFSFVIGLLAFWIYCVVDIVKSEFKNSNDKIIWLILILMVPFLGAILYIAVGKTQKLEGSGSKDGFV